jgi:HPt (histidine-containing phosphotransfer) domain-containing protein
VPQNEQERPAKTAPSSSYCETQSLTGWMLPAELQEYEQSGNSDFIAELIACYLTDADERLQILRKAASAGDFSTLSKQFHSLKGSSGSMGLSEVAGACREAEEQARLRRNVEYARMIDSIETALAGVRPAMTAYCRPAS